MDYQKLAGFFEAKGLVWTIDGVQKPPTANDLEDFLTRGRAEVDGAGEDDVLFIGGNIVLHKLAGHYDVYVRYGELGE